LVSEKKVTGEKDWFQRKKEKSLSSGSSRLRKRETAGREALKGGVFIRCRDLGGKRKGVSRREKLQEETPEHRDVGRKKN